MEGGAKSRWLGKKKSRRQTRGAGQKGATWNQGGEWLGKATASFLVSPTKSGQRRPGDWEGGIKESEESEKINFTQNRQPRGGSHKKNRAEL